MKYLADYKSEHKELSELITILKGLLTKDQIKIEANALLARERLRDLVEKVQKHLAGEDKELYPKLLVHEDPKIKTIAWGFLSGESHLRREFEKYAKNWLKKDASDYGEDFLKQTNEILDSLVKRIDTEEHKLFPRLESAKVEASKSKPMIELVDVIVHIDEKLDHRERSALVGKVREEEGVVSVALHDDKPHLMIVEYNPTHTSSASILKRVKREGFHAELVGL